MNFISSVITRFFIYLFALVPFWLLYIFADIFYLVTYKLVGYRVDVTRENLKRCFPEKSSGELKKIERQSFKNLSQITVESLKAFTMSKEAIFRRHKVINNEDIDHLYEKYGGLIAMPAHYNNWEWGAMSCQQLKWEGEVLYKPLSNPYLDKFIKKNRSRFGSNLISIYDTAKTFIRTKDQKKVFILASDQSPSNRKKSIWVDFFNTETAFLHGAEVYARKYNYPVVYVDVQRVKRGWYELELTTLTEDPDSLPPGGVTKLYAEKLEKVIRKEPGNWLWSHKRWKLTK